MPGGHDVVGQDDHVRGPVEDPGLAPVRLHDDAFDLAELDPIAAAEGPGEMQGQAGQDIPEHALKGEAEDGRQDGGGRRGRA